MQILKRNACGHTFKYKPGGSVTGRYVRLSWLHWWIWVFYNILLRQDELSRYSAWPQSGRSSVRSPGLDQYLMYLWVLDNLDCKNSRFFFSKSVKKSVKRGVRVLRARSARASHALRAREKLPSLALCFQPCSRPFVWLLARTWIRKNTDCFAVYGQPSISEPGNWNNLLTAMDIKSS